VTSRNELDSAGSTEAMSAPDEQAELEGEFVAEAERYFEAAEAALLVLQQSPRDQLALGTLFRALHTVKAVAAQLGLDLIAELAHRTETFLAPDPASAAPPSWGRAEPELALEALDMLRHLTGNLKAKADPAIPPGYHDLAARLRALPGSSSTSARSAAWAPDPTPLDAGRDQRLAPSGPGWVHLPSERLDTLLALIDELVVAQSRVSDNQQLHDARLRELEAQVSQCSEVTRQLKQLGLSLRHVSLQATFHRMLRVVRDTCRRSGRRADLSLSGQDIEIERRSVPELSDALMHLLRNAVDHGIEPGAERVAAGKPEVGALSLHAYRAAGHVVIEVADDGRGLGRAQLVARAKERRLIPAGAELSDAQISELIFLPGFSTRDSVTDVSGRGIGLDIVRRAIQALGGQVVVSSVAGAGTLFRVQLPVAT
jgi:two-component system, chemotaxis family, sensor kinase CheA